jgi:hypothetical protein
LRGRAEPGERLLDHGADLGLAFHAEQTVIAVVAEELQALADVVGVDAVADGTVTDRDARQKRKGQDPRRSCPDVTQRKAD